jgi:hypothetical protein
MPEWDRTEKALFDLVPARLAFAVLASIAVLAGCAPAQPLPEGVCGTLDPQPVRVPDDQCHPGNTTVRWYQADDDCLEADDRTDVGQPLDDDYLGEPCDPTHHHTSPVVVGVAIPTTTKATPAPPAPTKAAQTKKPTGTRTRSPR